MQLIKKNPDPSRKTVPIKAGVEAASAAGRSCYPLEEFTAKLEMAARNMHGVSDHLMPVELVLNVGVDELVEGFKSVSNGA